MAGKAWVYVYVSLVPIKLFENVCKISCHVVHTFVFVITYVVELHSYRLLKNFSIHVFRGEGMPGHIIILLVELAQCILTHLYRKV